jgi:transposase
VASKLTTVSAQDMIKAMIAGQRDPHQLAALARGRMKARHDDLVEAPDGIFDDHHGELAALLPARSPPSTARSPSWAPGPPS